MKRLMLICFLCALFSAFYGCGQGANGPPPVEDPPDTTTPPPDTTGIGEGTALIATWLEMQYRADTIHFTQESHVINPNYGSTYRQYKNLILLDIDESVNNAVAYITAVAGNHPLNQSAIAALLNARCALEIASAIRYVSIIPSLADEIAVYTNARYSMAIAEISIL